eukprot:4320791-Prymnesium_polylepis.2
MAVANVGLSTAASVSLSSAAPDALAILVRAARTRAPHKHPLQYSAKDGNAAVRAPCTRDIVQGVWPTWPWPTCPCEALLGVWKCFTLHRVCLTARSQCTGRFHSQFSFSGRADECKGWCGATQSTFLLPPKVKVAVCKGGY